MKLTGQRNQCQSCKAWFNSNAAFEKHRVGSFNPVSPPYAPRHCRTESDMLAQGMARNAAGYWITAHNDRWAA